MFLTTFSIEPSIDYSALGPLNKLSPTSREKMLALRGNVSTSPYKKRECSERRKYSEW